MDVGKKNIAYFGNNTRIKFVLKMFRQNKEFFSEAFLRQLNIKLSVSEERAQECVF